MPDKSPHSPNDNQTPDDDQNPDNGPTTDRTEQPRGDDEGELDAEDPA